MPAKIKGPALFLAQFAGDEAPFNSLENITKWAASLGYKGVQIPTFDPRLFDLDRAADSKDYCDEIAGICAASGVEITELSTHLQGQLVAVNPVFDTAFDGFAPLRCMANQRHGRNGPWIKSRKPRAPAVIWGWTHRSVLPDHWRFRSCIHGRSAPRA